MTDLDEAGGAYAPPAQDESRSEWLALFGVFALVLVGSSVPAPGLAQGVDWSPFSAPVLGGGVTILLVVRAAARATGMTRAVELVLYLLLSAAWAYGEARIRERVPGLVLVPGLRFEALFVLTLSAGNAVWWWLADRLDSSSLGSGAMLAFGCFAVPGLVTRLAFQPFGAGPLLDALVVLVTVVVLTIALALRTPEWPLPIGPWRAHGPADVLLAPLAVGYATLLLPRSPGLPASPWMSVVGVATLVVAASVVRRGEGRSGGIALAGLTFAGAMVLALSLRTGAAAGGVRAVFGGVQTIEARCDLPADLDVVRERARALVPLHQATVEADRIRIRYVGSLAADDVAFALTRSARVSLHPVDDDGVDPDSTVVMDCSYGPCKPLAVSAPFLTSADIARASFMLTQDDEPAVGLEFTPAGTLRLGEFTEAHVKRRMAIVVDGVPVSVPIIMEPIRGGRAVIEMGYAADPRKEALGLATALSTVPMAGHCEILSLR